MPTNSSATSVNDPPDERDPDEALLDDHAPDAPARTWPPYCPTHPGQRMYPHPKGWAWLCPVEKSNSLPSPQPHWLNRNGRAILVPLARPARLRAAS